MLPIEILMFITQVCISPTSLDKDVQNSVNCNQYMIQCMEIELKTSRLPVTGVAFSRCLVQYELDRK
jgi:hypothetical protein